MSICPKPKKGRAGRPSLVAEIFLACKGIPRENKFLRFNTKNFKGKHIFYYVYPLNIIIKFIRVIDFITMKEL